MDGISKSANFSRTHSTIDARMAGIASSLFMERPVTLDMIKEDPRLAEMVLVKNSRLSVQPVTAEEWKIVCDLAGVSA